MLKKAKVQAASFNADLTPSEFISLMYERTDDEGIIYIPGWHYDTPGNADEENSYRCCVTWSLVDYERIKDEFSFLYDCLEKIAEKYDALDATEETAKRVLGQGKLFEIWKIYVRRFEIGEVDRQLIYDIEERLEIVSWVKELSKNFADGKELSLSEKKALKEYLDVSVSDDEMQLLERYRKAIYEEAEKRVGKNICAYDLVIRAMRLCRLMSLKAPQTVVRNEARECAAAMVLHSFGVSRERVNNSVRLNIEKLEFMTEEELDEYYRPKKTNSRKSMAPLFVYLILIKHSDCSRHLRQQDILRLLEKNPYEIRMERKALSRIIHNLIDSQLSVYSDKTGVWIEQ